MVYYIVRVLFIMWDIDYVDVGYKDEMVFF